MRGMRGLLLWSYAPCRVCPILIGLQGGDASRLMLPLPRFCDTPLQATLPAEAAARLAGMSTKDLMWWRVMTADFGGGMDATGERF